MHIYCTCYTRIVLLGVPLDLLLNYLGSFTANISTREFRVAIALQSEIANT